MRRRLALEIALYDLIARKSWQRGWNNYYNAAWYATYAIAWRHSTKSPIYPTPAEVWRATTKLERIPLLSLIHIAKNSSFYAQSFVDAYNARVKA